jgi:hypothetical protein
MSVTVNQITQTSTVTESVTSVGVTLVGPQGPAGPTGPSGPSGPPGEAYVPDFFESSTPPLGTKRGDQWIVTEELGGG